MKQKPWALLFSLLLISYCSIGAAQNTAHRQIKKPAQKKALKKRGAKANDVRPGEEYRSKTQDILAIPVGGIVGFGLGHSMQNRYGSSGFLYTIIDGITLAAIPSVMGDCAPNDSACKDDQDRNGAILLVAFWGSRIIQAIDLGLFYSRQNYGSDQAGVKWNNAQLYLVPGVHGSLFANLAWSF